MNSDTPVHCYRDLRGLYTALIVFSYYYRQMINIAKNMLILPTLKGKVFNYGHSWFYHQTSIFN